MDLPSNLFLSAVPGDADMVAFRYDFSLEGKAVEADSEELTQTVTEADNGDLIIEGYAAVFDGMDREGENFAEGAFQRSIKSFLNGAASLCYHHKHDKLLGKVLDLREEEGKGLWMKARVDGAIQKHPELGTYYQQIKNGTLSALSIGGFFKRKMTEAGRKIVDMDFTEISTTPVPVHTGPSFAVVAGKALSSDLDGGEHTDVPAGLPEELREEDFQLVQTCINVLDDVFARLNKRGEGSETPNTDDTPGLL